MTSGEACKQADTLNEMMGPAIAAYIKEMERLSGIAGKPLYTRLPGSRPVLIEPGKIYEEPET